MKPFPGLIMADMYEIGIAFIFFVGMAYSYSRVIWKRHQVKRAR